MFTLIAAYQLYISNGGSGSSTSITDFLTWFNAVRNALDQPTQIKMDMLSNASYALFRGKTSFQIDQAVRTLNELDTVSMFTSHIAKDASYPHTVAGSSLPATAYIKEELAIWDKNVKENSQLGSSKINTLQTLL